MPSELDIKYDSDSEEFSGRTEVKLESFRTRKGREVCFMVRLSELTKDFKLMR